MTMVYIPPQTASRKRDCGCGGGSSRAFPSPGTGFPGQLPGGFQPGSGAYPSPGAGTGFPGQFPGGFQPGSGGYPSPGAGSDFPGLSPGYPQPSAGLPWQPPGRME